MPAQSSLAKKAYRRKTKAPKIPKKNLNRYQVKAVAKKVATKMLNKNIETKHVYDGTNLTTLSISNVATPIQLTTMTTGTFDNELIGSKCRLTSVYIKYKLTIGDGDNTVRLIVFQDKMQNQVTPVFQTQMFYNGFNTPITALYDVDNVPTRYEILYDKCIVLDTDDPVYCGHITIKDFPKRTLEFYGTPTVSGAIGMGHLYFYVVSDSLVTPHVQMEYNSAVFYKDA